MSFSEYIAALGIIFTTVVGLWLIIPRLNTWGKAYYLFLMAWSVPYAIGYVCDKQHLGSLWVRWHLLDMSYVQWATTLGVSIFVIGAAVLRKSYSQRAIVIASGISLAVFLLMAYGWETAQVAEAWQKYHVADWSDCAYYTVGMVVATAPFIAFRRFLATSAQTV